MSIRRTLSLAGITIIDTGGAQSRRLYPIADHLGSTIAIADSTGHLVQGLAYADFGKRYSAGWASPLTTSQAVAVNTTLSDRGYTGQESLDAIGLDDYNARLYDPTLGRFLSVDPLIGHPGSTQSINPYSYVENNPLNKTDPTGEASSEVCSGSGSNRVCTQMVTPTGSHIPQKVTVNQSTGAVSGALAGTNGHSIARSTDYNSMESFSPAGGQGQGTTPSNSTNGTNVNAHQIGNQDPSQAGGNQAKSPDVSLSTQSYKTRNEAADAFGKKYGPKGVKERQEYFMGIVQKGKDKFYYTHPFPGGVGNRIPQVGSYTKALALRYGGSVVALAHTHFDNKEIFSGTDVNYVASRIPFYLYNTNGQLRYLDSNVIRSTLFHSGMTGTNILNRYLQTYGGMAGECIYGCD